MPNDNTQKVINGAESLVRTLVDGGITVSFSNPGTSEMHFVAALDRVEGMRCVLTLFEGVATGAADGYARMSGRPASTLLHLGPGLANGLANLHNAKKASSPVVNIVGDHATYHRKYDAPLTSDVEAAARPFSHWVRTSRSAKEVAKDGAEAIAAARTAPGKIATLILPGDTAWNEGSEPVSVQESAPQKQVDHAAVRAAAEALRSAEPTLLLLGGRALFRDGLELAARIAAKTGCSFMAQTFNARIERGAGSVAIERIPYPIDQAVDRLRSFKNIILVGSRKPVGFFAYPGKPSLLASDVAAFTTLASEEEDCLHALGWLAEELRATDLPISKNVLAPPEPATGAINPLALASSLGALIPENAIVVDESVSTGRGFFPATHTARPHDWLQNMGGSIGYGMPLAVGVAIACPDRPVISLEGDGSAMYTIQALWTQARERLNVTTVVFANRKYAILLGELVHVGAQNVGRKALDMLDLGNPDLNFVEMARGMGVPGVRVQDMESFNRALKHGVSVPGPYLVEVVMG